MIVIAPYNGRIGDTAQDGNIVDSLVILYHIYNKFLAYFIKWHSMIYVETNRPCTVSLERT